MDQGEKGPLSSFIVSWATFECLLLLILKNNPPFFDMHKRRADKEIDLLDF